MRIGILTLHMADSYGAVLQAYALQRTLTGLGAENELVSFVRERPVRPQVRPKGPLAVRMEKAAWERAGRFEEFRRKRLVHAGPIPWREAARLDGMYDRFVAGSDQVWNLRIPEVGEGHFLTFTPPEKRFSYAASFGGEAVPERAKDWCAKALGSFRGLSVREESGRAEIAALTSRDAAVCVDPVLLPDRSFWEELAVVPDSGPYVFLFLMQYNAELAGMASDYAREHDLALRTVTAAFIPRFGFSAWTDAGPEDWLSLIRHAECVFTNSFHGTAFALLFGRRLRTAGLTGDLAGRSGRITELLRTAGLEGCMTDPLPPPEKDLAARLSSMRAASMEYLKGVVSDGKWKE